MPRPSRKRDPELSVLVKPGVEFLPSLPPAGYLILGALKRASVSIGSDLTITSGADGIHSGPLDPHHFGRAFDVRSHDFPDALKPNVLRAIITELRANAEDVLVETSGGLATEKFFGFLEKARTDDEHFHFQLRKSATFTVEDFLRL